MKFWAHFKGLVWVLGLGGLFMVAGMIIGSNLSIPDKLRAQSPDEVQSPLPGGNLEKITPKEGHSPFVYMAEEVKPAVVNISAESVTEDRFHTFMDDDFFRRFFGEPFGHGQPQEKKSRGLDEILNNLR